MKNTGTSVIIQDYTARALHSPILLYMYIDRWIYQDFDHHFRNFFRSGQSHDGSNGSICIATAANARAIGQPDGGTPGQGPVDPTIEREVLFPAADHNPIVLRHRGFVEADRGVLRRPQSRALYNQTAVALEGKRPWAGSAGISAR